MKLSSEVSEDKLRGAFYTPQPVVSFCLDRIVELLGFGSRVRVLEPSAGDGNFIEGIGRFSKEGGLVSPDVTCIEVKPSEAAKCAERLRTTGVSGTIFCESFFSWASENKQLFDVVVGNPPYIRYQFVPEQDRMLADLLLHSQGHDLHGVSNFWIPFVLLSLRHLRPGGAFALVLPSEFLATVSGSQVRNAFVRYFESLRIDLFPRNTFPDILQDVIVVSGVKATTVSAEQQIQFTEYAAAGVSTWQHTVPANKEWLWFS